MRRGTPISQSEKYEDWPAYLFVGCLLVFFVGLVTMGWVVTP